MMNITRNTIKRMMGVQKAPGRKTLYEERIIEMIGY